MRTDPHGPIHPMLLEDMLTTGTSFGLTKREYFAALAMQGLLATTGSLVSKFAVDYADELIEALNKPKFPEGTSNPPCSRGEE